MAGVVNELKCWPEYFTKLADGTKTVELRFDDRGYAVGDTLRLREWDPATGQYTRRTLTATITHVLHDPDGRWLQPGVVALSLADIWPGHDPYTTRIINLRDRAAVAAAKADGTFVRVDRRTRWGNPFHIGRDGSRYDVIRRYAAYLMTQPDLLADLSTLRGKTLACWCAPDACHAEVLRAKAEEGPDAISVAEMVGVWPDMTGGLSSDEYIRGMWDGS